MRLSAFILLHMDSILEAWVDFARTVETPLPALDEAGLRNHAAEILRTVALDMQSPQSAQEQSDKSRGRGPAPLKKTAAQTHAVMRLVAGFSLDQMVAEYRALRSSILRLWFAQQYTGQEHELDDMVRFNEAIDQALGESISSFESAVEATRKTVLGVLGHDLRTPLSGAWMGTQLLARRDYLTEKDQGICAQVVQSLDRANQMVCDLLDFARANLGTGIPVHKETTDLVAVGRALVAELRAGYPHANIVFEPEEKLIGPFDSKRMAQVFSNLIANALRHGDISQPITITLDRVGGTALLSVHNYGKAIPTTFLPVLFDPQARCSRQAPDGEKTMSQGLGLGLFIVSEIVKGHEGTIDVESCETSGTMFRIRLPVG